MFQFNTAKLFAVAFLLLAATCEAEHYSCFLITDRRDGGTREYDCKKDVHCKIYKPKPGVGRCFVGEKEMKIEGVANDEQVCCTRNGPQKAKPADKYDRVACSATKIFTLYSYVGRGDSQAGEKKIRNEVVACKDKLLKELGQIEVGKQTIDIDVDRSCVPEFCCTTNFCYYEIVDETKGRKLGCMPDRVDFNWVTGGDRKICAYDICLSVRGLAPDEEISCPSITWITPSK